MKRLFGILGRVLRFASFAAASAIAVAALLLYALEKSGWFSDYVRARIQGQLASSGVEFDLDSVELDWFGPGMNVFDARLGVDGALARIQRTSVRIAPFARPGERVRLLRFEGGRVRLCDELFDTLASLRGAQAPDAPTAPPAGSVLAALGRIPPLQLGGVQFDVAHRDWGDFPLGSVDAEFATDAAGRAQLQGMLAPSLAASDDPTAEIYLRGREERAGVLSIELSTDGFPISASALPSGTQLARLARWQPTGRLALVASAEISLNPGEDSQAQVRATLVEASLTSAATGMALRGLEVQLEASCSLAPGQSWIDPQAWSALAQATGQWRGTTIDAFARLGRAAGKEHWLRAELNLPACPLSADALAELGLWPRLEASFHALEPRGQVDLSLAVAVDELQRWSGALDARLDGRVGLTYVGWPRRSGAAPQGFPLPVDAVQGRVSLAFDPAQPCAFQLALLHLFGTPAGEGRPGARAQIDGVIAAPHGPHSAGLQAQFVLDFQGEGLGLGSATRLAVEGLQGTDWIWPAFQPTAGSIDGAGRLMLHPERRGISGRFDLRAHDAELTWKELPVRVSKNQGSLGLQFDPRHLFAVQFDLRGTTPTAESVRLRGRVQQDPTTLLPARARSEEAAAPLPDNGLLMDFEVGVRGMALRGSDREAVAGTWPGVGAALDLFQPSGKADVQVRAARARAGEDLEYRVEIEPRQVQLTPVNFSTPTRNVQGRVLVLGRAATKEQPASVSTRIAPLLGEWPQDARVAATALFPAEGASRLHVQGAGVDVTNRALIGAFREAFSGGAAGGGFDLEALSLDGRIDFAADVAPVISASGPPRNEGVYRLFLRDNAFRSEMPARSDASGREHAQGFGLSGLWGELVARDGALSGTRIQALLGTTPVLLLGPRFVEQDGGLRFTTNVQAHGLPLDREHLSVFLDADTVNAAIDRLHLSGWIDLDDAQLVYSGKTSRSDPKLALSGKVRPRDAFVDLGLPLSIESGEVELSELVLEGGHVRAWAKVQSLDGAIANRRLESARMLVTYVEPRLSILGLTGTLEGGRLSDLAQIDGPESERTRASGPAFTMDLIEPFTFELGLALREVQLSGLLRGLFQSEFADTGVVDAEIRLAGSLERLTGIVGDGWMHMRDTHLWSIPVVRGILSQLGMDSSAVFESMRIRYTLQGGVIRMDSIHVESPLLQLVGAGMLDLDGRLSHDLQVRYDLVDQLGPLTRMLYWIQNNLLSISVRGDMSRPQIVLKGMLSFLNSNKRGERDLPLPALSPLPPRF